ncbi:MAG TPA: hypothetical protein VKZ59_14265 [Acidobacteriota bacterium]|nr:hypothetical protein [Acidobacteriota bacterium]
MQQHSRVPFSLVFLVLLLSLSASIAAEDYIPGSKRDPFISLLKLRNIRPAEVVQPPPLAQRPPGLAGLLISEVTVSGTAANKKKNLVILRGIDDASYIAGAGSKLYDGFLKEITEDQVIFVREIVDTRGNRKTSEVVKRLYTEDR